MGQSTSRADTDSCATTCFRFGRGQSPALLASETQRAIDLGVERDAAGALAATVTRVAAQKGRWAALPVAAKALLLGEVLEVFRGMDHEAWAKDALAAAGYETVVPEALHASEMLMNTAIVGKDLEMLVEVLAAIRDTGKAPQVPVRQAHSQAVADVFPMTMADKAGPQKDWKAELWMNGETAPQGTGACGEQEGLLCALLGAGNQGFLSICDAFYLLFVEGMVCIVKHNPVRAYNHTWTEELLAPLIREGFVASVVGGVAESQVLLFSDLVDHVHMTGGKATHDAIVWGGDQRHEPKLKKPITSELGAVTPWIMGPGDWTDEEVEHHAKYFVTCFMNNNKCNCNAPQVLILPSDGFPNSKYLAMVKTMVAKRPHAPPYYPGTAARHKAWIEGLEGKATTEFVRSEVQLPTGRFGPPLPWVFSEVDFEKMAAGELPIVSRTEAFGPMLAICVVPSVEYWQTSANFCNKSLLGSLSVAVVMHPSNVSEEVVQELKYGCVAVNAWPGQAFSFCASAWGAFPGEKLEAVESGIGCVRNYLLFQDIQKAVLRAPFMTPVHIGTAPKPPALGEARAISALLCNNIDTTSHNADNVYCTGNFRPIEGEGVHRLPDVEGTLPAGLSGVYMRNGTNMRYKPHGKVHMFDGDAMLHAFVLEAGTCSSYAHSWIRTPRFHANESAGKELYPLIGDIALSGLQVAKKMGYMKTQMVAGMFPTLPPHKNAGPATNTLLIGESLYACVEVNSPFRIYVNPETGVVLSGEHNDWNGKIETFSAHSKVDPKTGDTYFFAAPSPSNVAAGPLCSYGVIGPEGTLKQHFKFPCGAQPFPPPAFLHDYFLTPRWSICVDHSLRGDMTKLSNTGFFSFDKSRTLRFGVLPRAATSPGQMIWIDTGMPGFVWHCIAAFEDGDRLTLWLPIFEEYPKDLPIHSPLEPDSFLYKVVVNLATKSCESIKKFEEVGVTERCSLNEAFVGSPDQRFAYLMVRGKEEMYNGFAKFDLKEEHVVARVHYGEKRFGGEALFSPRPGGEDEDDGWLLDVVYDKDTDRSELCVWDARLSDGSSEPVAKVKAPGRIPHGVHANFLTPDEAQKQWAQRQQARF